MHGSKETLKFLGKSYRQGGSQHAGGLRTNRTYVSKFLACRTQNAAATAAAAPGPETRYGICVFMQSAFASQILHHACTHCRPVQWLTLHSVASPPSHLCNYIHTGSGTTFGYTCISTPVTPHLPTRKTV